MSKVVHFVGRNQGSLVFKIYDFFGHVTILMDGPADKLAFIVDVEAGKIYLIRFKQEIKDLLCIGVNVLTEESIHWSFKENGLSGAIQL